MEDATKRLLWWKDKHVRVTVRHHFRECSSTGSIYVGDLCQWTHKASLHPPVTHNKSSLSFWLGAFISKRQKCRLRNTTAEVITGSFWIYWLVVSVSSCYSVCYWPGKELVDYITQYLSSIRERRVIPDVKPGYMKELLPDTAPSDAEDWESIFNDIEKVIMPGVSSYCLSLIRSVTWNHGKKKCVSYLFPQVVHWQSPHMHAYYPSLTSWPSMLGDMLADAINCVGFTWVRGRLHMHLYCFFHLHSEACT